MEGDRAPRLDRISIKPGFLQDYAAEVESLARKEADPSMIKASLGPIIPTRGDTSNS